jgi:hypothetical protein
MQLMSNILKNMPPSKQEKEYLLNQIEFLGSSNDMNGERLWLKNVLTNDRYNTLDLKDDIRASFKLIYSKKEWNDIWQVIDSCLSYIPSERPSCEQLKCMPLFENVYNYFSDTLSPVINSNLNQNLTIETKNENLSIEIKNENLTAEVKNLVKKLTKVKNIKVDVIQNCNSLLSIENSEHQLFYNKICEEIKDYFKNVAKSKIYNKFIQEEDFMMEFYEEYIEKLKIQTICITNSFFNSWQKFDCFLERLVNTFSTSIFSLTFINIIQKLNNICIKGCPLFNHSNKFFNKMVDLEIIIIEKTYPIILNNYFTIS